MAYTSRISWEVLRKIDSATFSGTRLPLGLPLIFPSYKLKLVNNSTSLVTVSIDGVNDIDVAPANSYWLYDETQAQFNTANLPAVPAGTGFVYLVSQYLVIS
jgi:hypothetical protein